MNKNKKIVAIIGILIIASLVLYLNWDKIITTESTDKNLEEESKLQSSQPKSPSKRYFSKSDNIVIDVGNNVLYTDNPTTSVTYYAQDNSGNKVHFKASDNAYVRILGVTSWYQDNVEIFHPTSGEGTTDDTMYHGEITIGGGTGKYLVKVCLGSSINLNSEGTMIWPFGCHEDTTSQEIDVYKK